uniref:Magnetosome protein MamR n=1 Tax=Magnetospirillum gryphiswaldense TaxID=55518 RepID=A4TTQ6_9PROT|nr:magnetosome protein MamR [Magnetospirillum gryphiswaldense MSR-1]
MSKGSALNALCSGAPWLWWTRYWAKEILPHRIYSSGEAAQLLGMERLQVLEMVRAGTIKAKKVGDNYRILGSNLVEYMNR